MVAVPVSSAEIQAATIHRRIPHCLRIYGSPFVILWCIFLYALFTKYDEWFRQEGRVCVTSAFLVMSHVLSFLVTRWNTGLNARITCANATSLENADCIHIIPTRYGGKETLVPLMKNSGSPGIYAFVYRQQTYVCRTGTPFKPLPSPPDPPTPLTSCIMPGLASYIVTVTDHLPVSRSPRTHILDIRYISF
ncbi:hypothetical protein CALVIDRAFT_491606 [Calocera viscosa TUFC12733]|uniref:P5A-ATPase transmembrane helical hairpin domain-containing protein n=1 Tax=Calocera viscosa (strain TUFC12733) TaxID=1330018 RepID=A0A167FKH7_CALVF|nr:hypothetical protein CALVIDRAFT_491606 [Calocera viscosa TUFC12733]